MRSQNLAILAMVFLCFSSSAIAQVPELISYQVYLTNPAGVPTDGVVDLKLRLYTMTGTLLWSLDTAGVDVDGGIANLFIGAGGTPASLKTVPFNGRQFLTISVNDDAAMATQLVSAPYALGMRGMYAFYREDGSANQSYNVVGGGSNNVVGAEAVGATIGGGGGAVSGISSPNQAADDFTTIGGGYSNTAGGTSTTVGGGNNNTATGFSATVGGGSSNSTSGPYTTVGGGRNNTASGECTVIPGGCDNTASAPFSFAAGYQAEAMHEGAFVWSDRSGETGLASTGPNQFLVRATGGLEMITDPTSKAGVRLLPGSGSWQSASSVHLKTDFEVVDPNEILHRVGNLDIRRWRYSGETVDIRHVGPTSEDFYAAFGLGGSQTSITTIDADGVALAAIQALYELVKEQAARIEELERRLAKK